MADIEEVLFETKAKMQKSVQVLERDLNSIRTGRASPSLLENLTVDYYGVATPLNQLASVTVPEARVLLIQPWGKELLKDLEKSILKSDLGLVPNNDGSHIRIIIPQLTEERRRDLVRLVGLKVEDGHVAVRNVRREALEKLRRMETSKEISQDETRRAQGQLQQLTDASTEQMNTLRKEKESEVMEV